MRWLLHDMNLSKLYKNYDGQKLISHQAWDTLCNVYKLLKFSRCFELQIFWFWFQCNFVVGNQVHSCSRRQASLWFHFLIIKERVLLSWYSHTITISVGHFRDIEKIWSRALLFICNNVHSILQHLIYLLTIYLHDLYL